MGKKATVGHRASQGLQEVNRVGSHQRETQEVKGVISHMRAEY